MWRLSRRQSARVATDAPELAFDAPERADNASEIIVDIVTETTATGNAWTFRFRPDSPTLQSPSLLVNEAGI